MALPPSLSPIGPGVSPAQAATVGSDGCAQTLSSDVGVTVTRVGADCVVSFTSGTNTWTVPEGVTEIKYLVVGGGGGGGSARETAAGGGGGAGGLLRGTLETTPLGSLAVVVGSGGAGGTIGAGNFADDTAGSSGTDSTLGSLPAAKGGGGGGRHRADGLPGGSGGGAGTLSTITGLKVGGLGTAGQGFAGGASANSLVVLGARAEAVVVVLVGPDYPPHQIATPGLVLAARD
jgi:hypothetical protein